MSSRSKVSLTLDIRGGVKYFPLVKFFDDVLVGKHTVFEKIELVLRTDDSTRGGKFVVASSEAELENVSNILQEAHDKDEDPLLSLKTNEMNGEFVSPFIKSDESYEVTLKGNYPVFETQLYFIGISGTAKIIAYMKENSAAAKKRERSESPNEKLELAMGKKKRGRKGRR